MRQGKNNRPFSTVSNYFGTPRIDREMTGGVAHDFRNILSVIDCGFRLADSNLGDSDKVRTFIAGAREGVEQE